MARKRGRGDDDAWLDELTAAVRENDLKLCARVLRYAANVEKDSVLEGARSDAWYLGHCARHRHTEMCRLLLRNGWRATSTEIVHGTKTGRNALHHAALHGHEDVCEALLAYSRRANTKDYRGMSPFYYAISNGHASVVNKMITYMNKEDLDGKHGNEALHIAAKYDNVHIYKLLESHGFAYVRDRSGLTPFMNGLHAKSTGVCSYIVNTSGRRFDDLERGAKGRTPMHQVVIAGQIQLCALLVDLRVAMLPDEDGKTALHHALELGYNKIARSLLEHRDVKQFVNVADNASNTALHVAALRACADEVRLLLARGALLWWRNDWMRTPLHIASSAGNEIMVREMLADRWTGGIGVLNYQDRIGATALHCATASASVRVVVILLDCGADVSIEDEQGRTALHYAAIASAHLCEILLGRGADANARCKANKTALDYAASTHTEESRSIVHLLSSRSPRAART